MNVIQIIMLMTAGGFVSTVLVVDTGLKHFKISEEVRGFIGKTFIVLGGIVMLFLTVLLAQKS